jgi:beta-galactosidase
LSKNYPTILLLWLCLMFNGLQGQVVLPSPKDSDHIKSLNGTWKFKYIPSTNPGNDSLFYQAGFDVRNWADIKTPGNWEIQGFAEPTYKNLQDGTGLYSTGFTIPSGWEKTNPIYIAFDGVQYGYTFYVNGKQAGQYASAYNRQTFDISPFIIFGKLNTLSVKVTTKPKGWEFDTNDDWDLSGIFRDVTLFSLPQVHIKDVVVQTFVKTGTADIEIRAEIEKSTKGKFPKNVTVTGELFDSKGALVERFVLEPLVFGKALNILNFKRRIVVNNPQLWNAETPNLYTVKLQLKEKDAVLQRYSDHIGIREVSWKDGILKLNGAPIKLKGVNHNDISPVNGRSITEAEMKEDLKLMREANVNFIRMAHYPPHPRLLELCDSLGFYVMDEIPYGFGDEHLKDTTYLPILKQRAKATVWRDKNRPCIIIWSVGNENPVTDIGLRTGEYVATLDATRPYCFPQTPDEFNKMIKSPIPETIGILNYHYAKAAELPELATKFKRPLILGEYAHALGLDFGSMQEIYEIMYEKPTLAGGAVWGFLDQGILRKAPKNVVKGEYTPYAWTGPDMMYDTYGNQGADGIVYANRVPQADYYQVRKVFTPVKALDDTLHYKAGKQVYKIRVNNRYDFTDLSSVKCKWQFYADTKILDSGTLRLNGKPHETIIAEINALLPEKPTASYYYIKIMFEDKNNYQFYEKTYVLQFTENYSLLDHLGAQKAVKATKKGSVITTDNYTFEVAKEHGAITLKNKNGLPIISEGPFARVGRKMTVAQDAATHHKKYKLLHTLWNPFILSEPVSKIKSFDAKQLVANYTYQPDSLQQHSLSGDIKYGFSDKGYININYSFTPQGKGDAIETGLSFIIPESYTEFRWVGKGPYAAYPVKNRLSEFGIFHLNISDIYFSGNRENVDCAVFTNKDGSGFALIAHNANIAVERSPKGIIVSHNAHVSTTFNKYEWPNDLFSFESNKKIEGNFTILPFTAATWPDVLKELFGESKKSVKAFQPFYYSYDQ